MMSLRGTEDSMPPLFQKIVPVRIFHASVLACTYALAFASYPSIARGLGALAYFKETYFGCVGASAALSFLALFFKPSMRLYVVFFLRCYVLVVLGYSIGGGLSAKLALGIGLMEEICVLVEPPLSLVIAGLALAALAAAQAWPYFFGPSGIVVSAPPPAFRADPPEPGSAR